MSCRYIVKNYDTQSSSIYCQFVVHILFNTGIGSSAGVRIYFYFGKARGEGWTGGRVDSWTGVEMDIEMNIKMHLIKIQTAVKRLKSIIRAFQDRNNIKIKAKSLILLRH